MASIHLRVIGEADRDAAFAAANAGAPGWPRAVFADREAFARWIEDDAVAAHAVEQDGSMLGVVAAMDVDGEREVLLAMSAEVGPEVSAEALRLLTVQEAERPLYACVRAQDAPANDVLARMGFVEHSRDGADVVYVLPPTLE